jgi:HD superfamily phosphodiesterase
MDEAFPDVLKMVEGKWLRDLYFHTKQWFSNAWIPSHDETHSIRSWTHAKNLMSAVDRAGKPVPRILIEQVILAVFLHDTGMTEDPGPHHGLISRKNAEKYLAKRNELPAAAREELLEAIHLHDHKSGRDPNQGTQNDHTDVFRILNASDDMDAFGRIGVYRFIEINLLRGRFDRSSTRKILTSLDHRYRHLENDFGYLSPVIREQKERYALARSFFQDLEREPSGDPKYARAVVRAIEREVVQSRSRPEKVDWIAAQTGKYPKGAAFFKGLLDELKRVPQEPAIEDKSP